MTLGNEWVADTLELPWRKNAKSISCIPVGKYKVRYRYSEIHRIKVAYWLPDVPNRTGILIHSANEPHELQGCIAVGVKFGEGKILNSRDAMTRLVLLAGKGQGTLEIMELSK